MRYSLIPVFLLLLAGCSTHEIPLQIKNDTDSIAFKWVPDKREGICLFDISSLPGKKLLINGETDIPEAKHELLKYLEDAGYEVLDSLRILPDESVTRSWGLVSVSVCNIKSRPSFSSEQVSQALMGTPVRILKSEGGWLLIRTPDNYLGWVSESGISEKDDAEMKSWTESERVIYTKKAGDILSITGQAGIITDVTAGSLLEISRKDKNYYTVRLPDGRTGIINRGDAADFDEWCSSVKPDAGRMIRFAKSMTGYPYMWGGTSTKAIDCSGFVKTIYFMSGIILARDASQQYLYGEPVDISVSPGTLLPGDLVFFGHLRDDGSKRITHVGMYIGDTELIHSSGMVRINSLDSTRANFSSYLVQTMMGARRISGFASRRGLQPVNEHPWYCNQQQATSNKQP